MFPIALATFTVLFFLSYRILQRSFDLSLPIRASSTKEVRFVMACIVTLAVLASALYIILSKAYPDSAEKWAFGSVGTVLGFWLRPEK